MDAVVRKIVMSRPIPERLIRALAVAPLLPPHEFTMWVRCGGRIMARPPSHRNPRPVVKTTTPSTKLSLRELQVIRLFAEGRTSKEIAYEMGILHTSVEMLAAQARYRLDRSPTNERAMLVAAARGLVELPSEHSAADSLFPTERQALAMWTEGASTREISTALKVNEQTVKGYLKRARRKLRVGSTAEAAKMVFG